MDKSEKKSQSLLQKMKNHVGDEKMIKCTLLKFV